MPLPAVAQRFEELAAALPPALQDAVDGLAARLRNLRVVTEHDPRLTDSDRNRMV